MENLFFIINPEARNGSCRKVWNKVEKVLQQQNIPYKAFLTEYSGHAKKITQSIAKKANGLIVNIVAVGGDGTMHEVINGAASIRNLHVAFIPGGSGNDFSRGFRVPKDPVKALQFILKECKREAVMVDIGKIEQSDGGEIHFINNMGAGFDALVSRKVNQSRIKGLLNRLSLGKFVYVFFLLKELFAYKCTDIVLTVDGIEYRYNSAWFVTVSNQPFYGGGMKISPEASVLDGFLNITIVQNLSKLKLLFVFISVFSGRHVSFNEVVTLIGKKIEIQSTRAIFAHADGEFIGYTPAVITVCPRALPVIIEGEQKE